MCYHDNESNIIINKDNNTGITKHKLRNAFYGTYFYTSGNILKFVEN